jgi:choline dehydrogenase-like flavoprotein
MRVPDTFDLLAVGGGWGGCTVAGRPSEDPNISAAGLEEAQFRLREDAGQHERFGMYQLTQTNSERVARGRRLNHADADRRQHRRTNHHDRRKAADIIRGIAGVAKQSTSRHAG